jgi:hypothetical protein
MQKPPSPRQYLYSSLFLIGLGWGGLALLLNRTLPTVWPRWGFFALWFIALTGTALPLAYFLNLRFLTDPPAEPNVIIREAVWAGAYGATLAWLQLGHLVTLWVWVGLAGGVIAVEYFIRLREQARWRPPTSGYLYEGTDSDDPPA